MWRLQPNLVDDEGDNGTQIILHATTATPGKWTHENPVSTVRVFCIKDTPSLNPAVLKECILEFHAMIDSFISWVENLDKETYRFLDGTIPFKQLWQKVKDILLHVLN